MVKDKQSKQEEQEAQYDRLRHKNQICLGACIVSALLVVAMVIASMQDAVIHSALRIPVVLTGITGLALCGYGVKLNRQMQKCV